LRGTDAAEARQILDQLIGAMRESLDELARVAGSANQ
jgi:hypothetical protein